MISSKSFNIGATTNANTASIPDQGTAWGATTANTGIEIKGLGLSWTYNQP